MIQVSKVKKYLGAKEVIKGISFGAEQGQILGLLGPNGAGKTTLLRLLAGYFYPDQGEIIIGERSYKKNPRQFRDLVGYLAENPSLYSDMTVQGIIYYFARLAGLKRNHARNRCQELVERLDLETWRKRPIFKLSRGTRQRVALAIALVNDPPVLLLDEPTTGLDPLQVQQFRKLLLSLQKSKTIVFSTHILDEVARICDHALIIDQGDLIGELSAEEIESNKLEELFLERLRAKGMRRE